MGDRHLKFHETWDNLCVVTGTDMADRAAAMAEAGADYELVGAGSVKLRIPLVDAPAAALLDVGGGVVDVDAVRDHLTAEAGHSVVHQPVFALGISTAGAAIVTSAGGVAEFDAVVLAAGCSGMRLLWHAVADLGDRPPRTGTSGGVLHGRQPEERADRAPDSRVHSISVSSLSEVA